MNSTSTRKPGHRVFILGLDGATFDLVKPWVTEGHLPNFARLLEEGAHGDLKSVVHPLSAQAWTSLVTGKNQGKHRIFDWRERDFTGYGYRFLNAKSRVGKTLWDLASNAEKHCIVINVPMTYPPDELNGVMISGRDTPGMDSDYTYPPTLKAELFRQLGDYVIVPDDWLHMRNGRPDEARRELFRELEIRFRTTTFLMKKYPWDLLMVVFCAPDGAAHFFWKYHDPEHPLHNPEQAKEYGDTLLRIYQHCDEQVGHLLERLENDTLLVIVSDHGQGSAGDRAIYLNVWLEEQGLLSVESVTGLSNLLQAPRRSLISLLAVGKRVFDRTVSWHSQKKLTALFGDLRSGMESLYLFSNIDWSRTKAYSEEIRGNIWVNLRGRDPQGIVEPGEEYEEIRDFIIQRLSDLRDPETGDQIIEKVYRREELYSGPFIERLPDLVVQVNDTPLVWKSSRTSLVKKAVRRLPKEELAKFETTGGHRMNGILLLRGPGIKPGAVLKRACLFDIAPTVLYALGLPIPEDMDGRILREAFQPEWLAQRPIESMEMKVPEIDECPGYDYSEEEADKIEELLRGLGYIE